MFRTPPGVWTVLIRAPVASMRMSARRVRTPQGKQEPGGDGDPLSRGKGYRTEIGLDRMLDGGPFGAQCPHHVAW